MGQPWEWVTRDGLWIVLAAVLGARAVHVAANATRRRTTTAEAVLASAVGWCGSHPEKRR